MSAFSRSQKLLSTILAVVLILSSMGIQAFASEEIAPPPPMDDTTAEAPQAEAPQPQEQTPAEDQAQPVPLPVPEEETGLPVPEEAGSDEVLMEELEDQMAAAEVETVIEPEAEAPAEGEEALVSDDPLYWEYYYGVRTTAGIPSFSQASPRALKSGEVLHKGVDVSEFQVHNKSKYDINWSAAKASGIDFAIIRAGYRGASYGTLGKDTYFDANIKAAKAAGLKVGAYIYSQAITPEEAKAEAIYLVNLVKNYQIDLPLVFDYEETTSVSNRRLVMSKLSRQTKTDICNAFCSEVEKYGYESMVYCNLSMVNNDIYRDQIGRLWLAHWTSRTSYTGNYEYWQIGDGPVSGFNGTVDLDFWFEPNGSSSKTPSTGGAVQLPQPEPESGNTQTQQQQPQPEQQQSQQQSQPQQQQQSQQQSAPAVSYTDVKSTAWYYSDVQWATSKNIVSGMGDNTFAPNSTATRGQVVTMLYRLKGSPAVSSSAGFTDLTQDYYKNAVNWAAGAKVVTGTGTNTFSPNGKITRQDLVTMLYRLKGSPAASGSLSNFSDKDSVKSYATGAMVWAVSTGIIKGYSDSTIGPGASATRAEVCTMLKRFADLG